MEYTLWDRLINDERAVAQAEAEAIIHEAALHSGPYGGMGHSISFTLYQGETIVAVKYQGQWFAIPEHQVPFIESELGNHYYDPAVDNQGLLHPERWRL